MRWVDKDEEGNVIEEVLAENITYLATTTEHYWGEDGKLERRYLIDHTLGFYKEEGIWQVDKWCYVIGLASLKC